MDSFSFKQSLHTLSFGANGFTFLTISHVILKLMSFFLNFQTCSLSVVEVLLCSNLKDDLCKLNLVLNSFSVSPIYVSWLFEVVSVTVALYTTHEAFAFKWARVFLSPCRPKLRVLTKDLSAKYFKQFILKLHIVELSFFLCCCK